MKKIILGLVVLSLVLSGCDSTLSVGSELDPLEMLEASCDELKKSYEKCDNTGFRDEDARLICKKDHMVYIQDKCTKD